MDGWMSFMSYDNFPSWSNWCPPGGLEGLGSSLVVHKVDFGASIIIDMEVKILNKTFYLYLYFDRVFCDSHVITRVLLWSPHTHISLCHYYAFNLSLYVAWVMDLCECLWIFQVIENYTARLDCFLLVANGFDLDWTPKYVGTNHTSP